MFLYLNTVQWVSLSSSEGRIDSSSEHTFFQSPRKSHSLGAVAIGLQVLCYFMVTPCPSVVRDCGEGRDGRLWTVSGIRERGALEKQKSRHTGSNSLFSQGCLDLGTRHLPTAWLRATVEPTDVQVSSGMKTATASAPPHS